MSEAIKESDLEIETRNKQFEKRRKELLKELNQLLKGRKEIKNNSDLRDELANVFDKLRSGKIGTKESNLVINISGKIIKGIAEQIKYNKMVQSKKPIDFMESNNQLK